MNWINESFERISDMWHSFPTAMPLARAMLHPAVAAMAVGFAVIWLLRRDISDMFYASCSGEYGFKRGRSIGRRIANEQNLWGIITRRYMKEHICDRLKKPFKVYLFFSRLLEIIYVPMIVLLLYISRHEAELQYAEPILTIVDVITGIAAILSILLENPRTLKTRFVDYKFKNRNGDYF